MKKIYIVHGWTYTIEHWTSVVSILRSKGVEVVQLKVPGLTASSDKIWTIEGYVEWLNRELEGKQPPIVLGHSNGGRISLNYLKKYPDRFEKLILLNSAGINLDNQKISTKRRILKTLSKFLKPLKYVPIIRKIAYRVIGGSDYDKATVNMKKTLDNMLSSDKQLDITGIKTPVKLIWGQTDTTTPVELGRKMAKLLPNSSIKEFDDWGHAPYITHPVELAQAILEELV